MNDKVKPHHRSRKAIVYYRLSTPLQITNSEGSMLGQAAMADVAEREGWTEDMIEHEKRDLGKSGRSANKRIGWKEIVMKIIAKEVGAVVLLETSRAARSMAGFVHFVELCKQYKVLIIAGQTVYDPRIRADALTLGVLSAVDENESGQTQDRTEGARRAKAKSGTLRMIAPWGFVSNPSGGLRMDPDPVIREQVMEIFTVFRQERSARRVSRVLRNRSQGAMFRRRAKAPETFDTVKITDARVESVLKNPAYAGTYFYGRSALVPKPQEEKPQDYSEVIANMTDIWQENGGYVRRKLENKDEWLEYRPNYFPGYIDEDEYLENQRILNENCQNFSFSGIARNGPGLLIGRIRCSKCGLAVMTTIKRFNRGGERVAYGHYVCSGHKYNTEDGKCQFMAALQVDEAVRDAVFQVLHSTNISFLTAAYNDLESRSKQQEDQLNLALAQAKSAAAVAKNRFDVVSSFEAEPSDDGITIVELSDADKKVAAEYHREYVKAIQALDQLKEKAARKEKPRIVTLSDKEKDLLNHLASDIKNIWAKMSTPQQKQLIRLLIKEVYVDRNADIGRIDIIWEAGAKTTHYANLRAGTFHKTDEEILTRISELTVTHKNSEIADLLNSEGYTTKKGHLFSAQIIRKLRSDYNIRVQRRDPNNNRVERKKYTAPEVIARIKELEPYEPYSSIASILNSEGFRTAHRLLFKENHVKQLVNTNRLKTHTKYKKTDSKYVGKKARSIIKNNTGTRSDQEIADLLNSDLQNKRYYGSWTEIDVREARENYGMIA